MQQPIYKPRRPQPAGPVVIPMPSVGQYPNPRRHGHAIPGRGAIGVMKKGGKVKKTGLYKLHRGEKVLAKKLSPASATRLKARASGALA